MHISGKEYFIKLKLKNQKPRIVPAFTIQALQKNTIVKPPPKHDLYVIKPLKKTLFRKMLEYGDIPIVHKTQTNNVNQIKKAKRDKSRLSLEWIDPVRNLDYCYFFPLAIEGVADPDDTINFIAKSMAMDMISDEPNKILGTIPLIIAPIKKAMNTRDPDVIVSILKLIQVIIKNVPCAAQALIPYFRQILPICNLFINVNLNLLNGIDQDYEKRVGDVIEHTLEMLEMCGGREAYINIKYLIPTYQSVLTN